MLLFLGCYRIGHLFQRLIGRFLFSGVPGSFPINYLSAKIKTKHCTMIIHTRWRIKRGKFIDRFQNFKNCIKLSKEYNVAE